MADTDDVLEEYVRWMTPEVAQWEGRGAWVEVTPSEIECCAWCVKFAIKSEAVGNPATMAELAVIHVVLHRPALKRNAG
jgi:hypothetical protein